MEKLKNKMVLIVDDDYRNTFALRSYPEMQDIKIVVAENGEQAISCLHNDTKPDIILLDTMPVMDGYETPGILKQDTSLKKIPVTAVTAGTMKGGREKCIEAGHGIIFQSQLIGRYLSIK